MTRHWVLSQSEFRMFGALRGRCSKLYVDCFAHKSNKWRQIALVGRLQRLHVFLILRSSKNLWDGRVTWQQVACFHAHNEVANRSSSSSVAVHKWVNSIYAPQGIGRQNRRLHLFPLPVRTVYEVGHKRRDEVMRRSFVFNVAIPIKNVDGGRPILPGFAMESHDCLKIERLDQVFRKPGPLALHSSFNHRMEKINLAGGVGCR